MRALSIQEIEREREIMEKTHEDYVRSNAATFTSVPDARLLPGRWAGVRGVADRDCTQAEAAALVNERQRVGHILSVPERKLFLLKFRGLR